jgi:hypothetical protein
VFRHRHRDKEEEKFTLTNLVWCVASIEEKLGVVADPLQPLEFPRFDGTGKPFSWLIDCEKYFCARRTPTHKRVTYASFYLLDDAQLWYYQLPNDDGPPSWDQFMKLVINQFTSSFIITPSSKTTLGDDTTAPEGAGNSTILAACGDGALHAKGGSIARCAVNGCDTPNCGDSSADEPGVTMGGVICGGGNRGNTRVASRESTAIVEQPAPQCVGDNSCGSITMDGALGSGDLGSGEGVMSAVAHNGVIGVG